MDPRESKENWKPEQWAEKFADDNFADLTMESIAERTGLTLETIEAHWPEWKEWANKQLAEKLKADPPIFTQRIRSFLRLTFFIFCIR
jgi:hypothetical protein